MCSYLCLCVCVCVCVGGGICVVVYIMVQRGGVVDEWKSPRACGLPTATRPWHIDASIGLSIIALLSDVSITEHNSNILP